MQAVFHITARAYDMQEAGQTTGKYYFGMNKVYLEVRAHPVTEGNRRAIRDNVVTQVES